MKLLAIFVLISTSYAQVPSDLPQIVDNSTASPSGVTQYVLPPLPYPYNGLEPHISAQIMELHHKVHHQAYVNNLNNALRAQAAVMTSGDIEGVETLVALQETIKFNGGGHINHSLFWKGLVPAGMPDSSPQGELVEAIKARWGSVEGFDKAFKAVLLGIKGSGWGWLVCNAATGQLSLSTTKDQDPVLRPEVAILGIDMWEHAFYLQYFNDKASYLEGIWNVLNWKVADERYASCLKH
ncbi:hypothetical protein ABW19_dt0208956 [Dactylella cylindrospora]|nr:hypothetical protein ABW19_dt0208956 [Dactylella cylindrospora]